MFQWGIEYEWTPKFEIKHDLNNSKHRKYGIYHFFLLEILKKIKYINDEIKRSKSLKINFNPECTSKNDHSW